MCFACVSWSKDSVATQYLHNITARSEAEATNRARYEVLGYKRTDVTLAPLADEPYLGAGLNAGLGPLPPVGNSSFPHVTSKWELFLSSQHGLSPADFGAHDWSAVMPSGMPTSADPARTERARYYWTLRFMLHDAELDYNAGTEMTQETFYPEIYTYANTNNFGGRFFYPGQFDNQSLLAFDFVEMGRQNSTSLLWTEGELCNSFSFSAFR